MSSQRSLLVLVLVFFSFWLLVLFPTRVDAQDSSLPDQVIIFVIDLSGSMNEVFDGSQTKLDIAKEAFAEAFADVSPNAFVGIRVYGDQFPATAAASREVNCTQDTRLVSPIQQVDPQALIDAVSSFTATGDTAIALALEAANEDIPDGTLGTVVLFSDGRDECFDADLDGNPDVGPSFGEDPCLVAQQLAGDGVDLRIDRVETVGFGADAAAEQELRCIADATGGSYTPIETPADARDVLPELLAAISSPRDAERLGGTPIVGAASEQGAPDFERIGAGGSDGRYTDTIEMNSEKWYRFDGYGPGSGTFTATAFGLPAQEGINFNLRMFIPESDQTFFDNQGDSDAGLPRRPTASIRCPGCSLRGFSEAPEVFWIVSLSTENADLGGTYDLELLTDGPAFGGTEAGCVEPQECWYAEQVPIRQTAIEEANAELDALLVDGGGDASIDLNELRDQLDAQEAALESAESAASAVQADAIEAQDRAAQLQIQADEAGDGGASLLLPLLLGLVGLVAGAASFFAGGRGSVGATAGSIEEPPPPTVPPAEDVVGNVVSAPAPAPPPPQTPEEFDAETVQNQIGDDAPTVLTPSATEAQTSGEESTEYGDAVELEVSESEESQIEVPPTAADGTGEEVPEPEAEESDGKAPGWYTDPKNAGQLRWWDGAVWSPHVRELDGGEPS